MSMHILPFSGDYTVICHFMMTEKKVSKHTVNVNGLKCYILMKMQYLSHFQLMLLTLSHWRCGNIKNLRTF